MANVLRQYDEGTYDGAMYDWAPETAGLPVVAAGASSLAAVATIGGSASMFAPTGGRASTATLNGGSAGRYG